MKMFMSDWRFPVAMEYDNEALAKAYRGVMVGSGDSLDFLSRHVKIIATAPVDIGRFYAAHTSLDELHVRGIGSTIKPILEEILKKRRSCGRCFIRADSGKLTI